VFDVPGTHNSSGCFDFGGTAEREAAAAVVDHLGELPWTNGKVGMIGISYDGSTQLEAAVEQPEHLAAIVAQAPVSSQYHYLFWAGTPLIKTPVHGTAVYDFVTAGAPPTDRSDPAANIPVAEDRVAPCDRLEHQQRVGESDPVFDEFWAQRSYLALAERIEAPILLEAGWLDTNVRARNSTRLFQALRPEVPKRLSIGQWDHGSGQFEDSVDLRHAWFDEFLLGLHTGVRDQPEVDNQPTNGERRAEPTWPPRGTTMVDLALVDRAPGIGEAGLREGESIFTDNNPAFTGFETDTPDLASTYVAYETAPLAEDVRISGAPRLRIRATSTNASTHYCVNVITWPTIQSITEGYLNTRNRNGLDVSEALVPGQPYDATIDLYDTDIIVPKGQSIFVWIASTSLYCRQDDQPGSTNDILPGAVLELPISAGAAALGG
jgi:X-Pro dipeptidyl-peptidase